MARISELLKVEQTLSFEFSAPRDPEGQERLYKTLDRLAPLKPSFTSVTYGPSGTTRGPTAEVIEHINKDLGVTGMPHLTCVSHTKDEIAGIIDRYAESGIENLLALHGDLPEGAEENPSGYFQRAVDLMRLARERADFSIGVAAHPEGHPKAESMEEDREHQAEKLKEADFAVTQFFFEPEYYERFVEEMAARGVNTPVIAGIMPPQNLDVIARMSAMNNTEFPKRIRDRLEAAGDDAKARRAIAVEESTKLSEKLLKTGVSGLHIYTLNFAQTATEIVRNLGIREGLAAPAARGSS